MLFKVAFVISLAQFFSVGELLVSDINEVEQNGTQNWPSKQSLIDYLNKPNFRRVRQVATNPEIHENENSNSNEHSQSLLDYLLDGIFSETSEEVENDWENIFKELSDIIDENKNKHLNSQELNQVKEEVNKMILQGRQALQSLSLAIAEIEKKDMEKLTKLIIELIQVITEIIDELYKEL